MGDLIGKEAAHNKGQEDFATGIREKPHNFMDFFVSTVNPLPFEGVSKEEMNEENEAYEAGYAHAREQSWKYKPTIKRAESESSGDDESDNEGEEKKCSSDDSYSDYSDDDDDSGSSSYTRYSPSSESSISSRSVINSFSNSGSLGNNDVAKQDDQMGVNVFLFIVISIIGLIWLNYDKTTSEKNNQLVDQVNKQRPANLESDVSLGITDRPVEEEKLAGDVNVIITRDNESVAETPPLPSASAQSSLDGTVEYIQPGNLYIKSTGEQMSGWRIFVQLQNGNKADVFLGNEYNESFNPGERVNVISNNSQPNGTIEYARYDSMENEGERIVDSEIAIRLDDGGIVVVIFPSQEVIFNKGERVRSIIKGE